MKLLVLAIVMLSASSALAEEDLTDPRTFYTANGGMYLNLNSTSVVLGLIAIGVLGAALFALFSFSAIPPAYEKQGNYYNPDLIAANNPNANAALAYAVAAQQQQQQYRQKRELSYGYNLATKMSQLEQAFKKFEVKTEECKMFVACEAAQFRKLEENVLIVKIANNILKNVDANEQDKIRPSIMNAYTEGRINHEKYVPNACGALRERCYVAHNA